MDFNNIKPEFMDGLLYAVRFLKTSSQQADNRGERLSATALLGAQLRLQDEYDRIQAEREEATKASINSQD